MQVHRRDTVHYRGAFMCLLGRFLPGHPDEPQQAGADDISDMLLADMLHVPQFANQ